MLVNAVIGIEYDDTTYPIFVRPLSFSQWTLMAKPRHAILERAVQRVLSNLEFIARQKKAGGVGDVLLEMRETLEATGPGMMSDVVMEVLRDQIGTTGSSGEEDVVVDWGMFQGLREPMLVGDVLILPINGFGSGQKHSHSGVEGWGRMLVRHHFGRSWYTKPGGKNAVEGEEEEEAVKEEVVEDDAGKEEAGKERIAEEHVVKEEPTEEKANLEEVIEMENEA